MEYLNFNSKNNFNFHWSGKFEATHPEWIHLTRFLADYELIVVIEGTLYIGDSKNSYEVKKGEALLMSPDSKQHGYRPSNCSFYWMHFGYNNDQNDAPLLNESEYIKSNIDFDNNIILPIHLELPAMDRIIVLMKQLQDSDKRYHDSNLNSALSLSVLCEISNQANTKQRYSSPSRQEQVYNDIVDYISWHICENIRVSDIADYFGYNEKYLSTFFRKFSGNSLKQYILQAKMDHAKASLSDSNHSISQIAYNIGYSDPHNFSNAFKKVTGLTPSEYRTSFSKRLLFYK